jgi:hypothetical protein
LCECCILARAALDAYCKWLRENQHVDGSAQAAVASKWLVRLAGNRQAAPSSYIIFCIVSGL